MQCQRHSATLRTLEVLLALPCRPFPALLVLLLAVAPGRAFHTQAADSTATVTLTTAGASPTLVVTTTTATGVASTSTPGVTATSTLVPTHPTGTGSPTPTTTRTVLAATLTPTPVTPTTATATSTRTAATATSTTVATPAATAAPAATATSGPVKEPAPPQHYVVLIVIDAGRPDYLNLPGLPHIRALMNKGVVYDQAWDGQLNSSTPDVHVTLGTGTLPKQNGFMGFGWADPVSRRVIDFRTLLAHGEIDPVLKALPEQSIATRLHELIPGAKSIAASGHKDYAAVGLGGGTADYELYGKYTTKAFVPTFMHNPPPLTPKERASLNIKRPLARGAEDAWAFKYVTMVAAHVHPRLLMLNVPETDTWGHWFGPNDKKLFTLLMQNVDKGVGEIEDTYRKLGILSKTDFIITADHGMMQSIPSHNWRQIQVAAAGEREESGSRRR